LPDFEKLERTGNILEGCPPKKKQTRVKIHLPLPSSVNLNSSENTLLYSDEIGVTVNFRGLKLWGKMHTKSPKNSN
jgi:hypothetical protein